MKMASAYNAGYDAFVRGDNYLNPYATGTIEFNWFERGFFQALKRSSRGLRLSRPNRSWSFQLMRDAERHMKSITGPAGPN